MKKNKIILESVSGLDIQNSRFIKIYEIWKQHPTIFNEKKAGNEENFVDNFFRGYNNRPSIRVSKASETISDTLIEKLIKVVVTNISTDNFTYAHRVEMAIENIIGSILEEYIHSKLYNTDWVCCWGEIIQAVDFIDCNTLSLLQIKNKDNTENSSSSKIRDGEQIQKWFRLEARTGKTHWEQLNSIVNIPNLFSEDDFQNYAVKIVQDNPNLINLTFKN